MQITWALHDPLPGDIFTVNQHLRIALHLFRKRMIDSVNQHNLFAFMLWFRKTFF